MVAVACEVAAAAQPAHVSIQLDLVAEASIGNRLPLAAPAASPKDAVAALVFHSEKYDESVKNVKTTIESLRKREI